MVLNVVWCYTIVFKKWVCLPSKWAGCLSLRKDVANTPCFHLARYRKHSNDFSPYSVAKKIKKLPKMFKPSVGSTKLIFNKSGYIFGISSSESTKKSLESKTLMTLLKRGSFHRPCNAGSSRRALFWLCDCWLSGVTRCRPASRGEARSLGMGMPWSNGVTVSQ